MLAFEQKKRQLLIQLITELEVLLRHKNLWQAERPSGKSLASTAPFAIDSLNFEQWLQFIFIEKMLQILQLNLPLPTAMTITPMATEYFKLQSDNCPAIVTLLTRIDVTINEKQRC